MDGARYRTTGEGVGEGAGVRWSMLDWMDGDRRGGRQRQLQRRPGQRRQQRLAVAGWAASAAGRKWAWSRRRRWVWMRGRFSLKSRSGRWGVSRRESGVRGRGERRRRFGCVSRKGSGRGRERSSGLGARQEERGRVSSGERGVARTQNDGDHNNDGRATRTGRGWQRHPQRGRHRQYGTDNNGNHDGETRQRRQRQ